MPDTLPDHQPSRWSFGRIFRGAPPSADNGSEDGMAHPPEQSFALRGKHLLLDEINRFILHHDLEVSPGNLSLAYEALSGCNPQFASLVTRRLNSGLPLTQSWLEEHASPCDTVQAKAHIRDSAKDNEHEVTHRLLNELETGLRQFSLSTSQARTATKEYGQNLSEHSLQLSTISLAEDSVRRLYDLTNDMAEKTRHLETDMQEQEDQAKNLSRRLTKVKRDAELDPLTGLPNHRTFDRLFRHEVEHARAEAKHLTLAICQIDAFEQITHHHGHNTGDRVLKLVAKILGSIPEDNFHLARHGSEEFAMLFRGVSTLEAKALIDDIRDKICARNLINQDTNEPMGTLSFSAGIANVFAFNDTSQALRAADSALYNARQTGQEAVLIA